VWFVSGIYLKNTLQKGDNADNKNNNNHAVSSSNHAIVGAVTDQ